ncbi:MAG: prepilin peptidase [Blastocatellales bacterium]
MSWFDKFTVISLSLTIFVVVIAIFDLRERRIPNVLVFPAMLIGLTLHFFDHMALGFLFAIKGLAMGFSLLLIPYLVRGMKAGDVKFLMAIGSFVGAFGVVRVLLITVLIYPIFAAVVVIRQKKAGLTWLRFRRVLFSFIGFFIPGMKLHAMQLENRDDLNVPSAKTPFGVAIAAGTLISIYTSFLKSAIQ